MAKEKTIKEIFDTLTDEQKDAVYAIIGSIAQRYEPGDEDEEVKYLFFMKGELTMIKLRIENYFKYFTDEEKEKYKHGKVYEFENLVDVYNFREEVDETVEKICCYGAETELEIDPSEPNLMVLSIYD